jgi:mannose-1-phosphate guanylyltransferase
MWPIFSKTLIQLQIEYCKDLGIDKIYINVHFLADEVIKHVESLSKTNHNITILYEENLLDSGGALHNLAKRAEVNYQGNVLLVNADQFLFFDDKYFVKAKEYLKSTGARAVLFGIKVDKKMHYNETVIEGERLVEIKKNGGAFDYNTYSGLGIVKLDSLKPVEGASKFFQTVVDYKHEVTYMFVPDIFEYWDFGTASLYVSNIKKIISLTDTNSKKLLLDFFERHKVSIIQSNYFVSTELNSIDLETQGRFVKDSVIYKNITQII